MYIIAFTSGKEVSVEKVAQILLAEKVLCNVEPMSSVILDKASQEYKVETGAKFTIFDVEPHKFINLWMTMRKELGVHCLWLEADNFAGCTCHWPVYRQHCANEGKAPLECSEY